MTAGNTVASDCLSDASYHRGDQPGDPNRRRCPAVLGDTGPATAGC